MKRQLSLARHYQAALQKHLQGRLKLGVQPAQRLGRRAVVLGLETLDLARIHKAALNEVMQPGNSAVARDRMVERAGIFFAEAISPIEETHRAGVKSASHLKQRNKTLRQRTTQLAIANRHLKRGIARRKTAEAALRKSERHHVALLRQSHHLQKHLQHLTHQILSAQESERRKISHDLQDEIAQTLVAINVRLLTLRRGAAARTEVLTKEIADTQRLVEQSVRIINRFASKFRRTG
jgi:signal transduction histidine kinase